MVFFSSALGCARRHLQTDLHRPWVWHQRRHGELPTQQTFVIDHLSNWASNIRISWLIWPLTFISVFPERERVRHRVGRRHLQALWHQSRPGAQHGKSWYFNKKAFLVFLLNEHIFICSQYSHDNIICGITSVAFSKSGRLLLAGKNSIY